MKKRKISKSVRKRLSPRRTYNIFVGDTSQLKEPYFFATNVQLNEGMSFLNSDSFSEKSIEISFEQNKPSIEVKESIEKHKKTDKKISRGDIIDTN